MSSLAPSSAVPLLAASKQKRSESLAKWLSTPTLSLTHRTGALFSGGRWRITVATMSCAIDSSCIEALRLRLLQFLTLTFLVSSTPCA